VPSPSSKDRLLYFPISTFFKASLIFESMASLSVTKEKKFYGIDTWSEFGSVNRPELFWKLPKDLLRSTTQSSDSILN